MKSPSKVNGYAPEYVPVISYELRDEEGETMIVGFSSDSDLVEFMTSLQGVYQIRLVTDEYLYIGYIEL